MSHSSASPALNPVHTATAQAPKAGRLLAALGRSLRAWSSSAWLDGADASELAREHYLSQATDAVDLECRVQTWEAHQRRLHALPYTG